ncbi:ribonuclease Z [Aureivirga sp. CE67]|uniref:ribonuclease Z n=1 Tax=Aureivirga sp. CE67 TaxID=1788983 RepID=UPI0018CB9F72|nr:ribonuclease Z [Aureivirga sp. CE67]
MSLKLTILGCHSATPKVESHPTSQILEIKNHLFLIDCGEGTQVQLRKYGVKFSKINHIFISHLHGDHFYGLVGLISTFSLLNRRTELHVYGPKGIKELITMQLKMSDSWTNYLLIFHELDSKESVLLFEDKKVEVYTIPLKHRIYANGFLFKEKTNEERKLNMTEIKKHREIEICDYHNLKRGRDFKMENGDIIPNSELTLDPPKNLSYAFCSDTMYFPPVIPIIENVDLLYHESTFLKKDEEVAEKTKHSTAEQASLIAKEANVGQLILGHYSGRYKNLELFKEEAQDNFENVILAETGKVIELK